MSKFLTVTSNHKIKAVVLVFMLFACCIYAADNFSVGHSFDGTTGLKTGADLEDLVSQATLLSNDSGTNRIYDNITINTDGGTPPKLQIKDGGVSSDKLAADSVSTAAITNEAVTQAKLAIDAVDTTNLVDSAVTTVKIADSNVTDEKLANGVSMPIGTVLQVASTNVPSGWLSCDGSAISRETYSNLYAVVGDSFGEGDGATTFNVPDLRGVFVRIWDNGAGNDPDAASRTALNTGGATGDNVGSYQADEYESHTHQYSAFAAGATYELSLGTGVASAAPDTVASGGNETRPKNVYLNAIIKY